MVVSLTLTANLRIVEVTDIRVVVVSRSPAVAGTYMAPAGAGDVFEYAVSVDLDSDPPVSERFSTSLEEGWEFPLTMDDSDQVHVSLIASTRDHLVEFEVAFDWYDPIADEAGTVQFGRSGTPYIVTGTSAAPEFVVFARAGSGLSAQWGVNTSIMPVEEVFE